MVTQPDPQAREQNPGQSQGSSTNPDHSLSQALARARSGAEPPAFPGGTAVSGLQVYDWTAADGHCGGSPHVHLACTEAYVVVGGNGELHTLTASGAEKTPLHSGVVAWFGPGTVHRAVNLDGALRVVVVMQNSGLPEAGDAVLTFPPEILADPDAYQHAAQAGDEQAARRRRDLAVEGYLRLAKEIGAGDIEALAEFYRQAIALRADRLDAWEGVWRSGPLAAAQRTAGHIAALREGWIDHLLAAGLRAEPPPETDARTFGMCGRLDTYPFGPPK
ncbi:MAG TPA: cupin domain-containing protein [Actinocrinis sp.]|jgi:mannose-6-phosphate isomerase-like protein (cupin superfamily)